MHLLFGNKREDDILLRKELEGLREKHGVELVFTLSQEKKKDFNFGRVDQKMILDWIGGSFSNQLFMICGSSEMTDGWSKDLTEIGVPARQIMKYG